MSGGGGWSCFRGSNKVVFFYEESYGGVDDGEVTVWCWEKWGCKGSNRKEEPLVPSSGGESWMFYMQVNHMLHGGECFPNDENSKECGMDIPRNGPWGWGPGIVLTLGILLWSALSWWYHYGPSAHEFLQHNEDHSAIWDHPQGTLYRRNVVLSDFIGVLAEIWSDLNVQLLRTSRACPFVCDTNCDLQRFRIRLLPERLVEIHCSRVAILVPVHMIISMLHQARELMVVIYFWCHSSSFFLLVVSLIFCKLYPR
jgi:hypothetical protein